MHVIILLTWKLTTASDMKNHHCISTVRTLITNIRKPHQLIKFIDSALISLPAHQTSHPGDIPAPRWAFV